MLAILLLLLITSTYSLQAKNTSTSLSKEERIVFSSNRNGNYDIFTIKPDGSDLQQLTKHSARDAWPKWSPDGRQIIFCSERMGKNQIYIMNADGTQKRNLSNNRYNELDPVISPNGKYIAFITKETGSYQLHIMDIDGTNRRQLTNSGLFCGRADWSPDSKKLVYLSQENGYYELYRINADGSNKLKLTDFKTEVGSPAWSKHGYYIMFHAHENEVDKLFQIKPDGSELKKLFETKKPSFLARWNGESTKFVYSSIRNGNYDLFVKDFTSKEEIQLTNHPAKDLMCDWFSPQTLSEVPVSLDPPISNKYRLAFTSYRGGSPDIYSMKVDGSDIKQHTDSDDSNSFAQDAKDKTHLIFRRSTREDTPDQLDFKVNLITGEVSPHNPQVLKEGSQAELESPNGRYITYSKKVNDYFELFLYDKLKDTHEQISNNKEEDNPAQIQISFWSFESDRIAFLSGKDYYNLYLRIYHLKTGKTETLTKRGYMFAGVAWLKGENGLIINIKIRNKTFYELWSINTDGSQLTQLTNNPGRGNIHPKTSPDGQWIAFESGRNMDDGEIYLMRPDGSQQIRLTFHPSYEGRPEWVEVR